MFGPVAEENESVRIATRKDGTLLAPPLVATLEIQDNGSDPAVARAFQALQSALESLEQAIAHRFDELSYQSGEDVFPLSGQFVATDKQLVVRDDKRDKK
jgi:hypothetical protein